MNKLLGGMSDTGIQTITATVKEIEKVKEAKEHPLYMADCSAWRLQSFLRQIEKRAQQTGLLKLDKE